MPEPYYEDGRVTVWAGDCLDVLATLPDASVDSVVTDPPYGLEFMGKEWDSFKTSAVGNPNMAAKQRMGTASDTEKGNPWASERPSHGAVRKVARCMKCGKQKFNHENSRCHCAEPLWDYGQRESMRAFQAWCELWATECLRVLKPGGHLLAFGGTRTSHRLACAIEDAGFEIRDSIAWLYGSGFPKSLAVDKAIDKAAGAEREVVGDRLMPDGRPYSVAGGGSRAEGWDRPWRDDPQAKERNSQVTAPATDDARTWQGWGTALKPAHEPIVVARKPLNGTVAGNVLQHGTGALNISACRVDGGNQAKPPTRANTANTFLLDGASDLEHLRALAAASLQTPTGRDARATLARAEKALAAMAENESHPAGRWPANVILDEDQAAALDQQSGRVGANSTGPGGQARRPYTTTRTVYGDYSGETPFDYGDSGGASRFFYVAKADSAERPRINGISHATVKPLTLMRWLVRLVTPPGGTVLEPFAGSGATVEACVLEGFRCIAIERETDYLPLITSRLTQGVLDFGDPA